MYTDINEQGFIDIFVEKTDLCEECIELERCPLIACIQHELTIIKEDNLDVSYCPMFCNSKGSFIDMTFFIKKFKKIIVNCLHHLLRILGE